MVTGSQLNFSPCLWRPQEDEIKLAAHQERPERHIGTYPYGEFWYLYLTHDFTIALGRHPEDVASDAAAMRKLAMVATEAAEKLERRAASVKTGQEAGGSGDG